MRQKIHKIAVGFLTVLLTLMSASSTLAFGGGDFSWSGADVVGSMDAIFSDLGIDKNELRYNAQTMNVSRYKKNPPQVSVVFEPSDPAPGEKITAVATPTYFMNSKEDLYFTWFLKSEECDRTNDPSSEQKIKCDLDGNGRINVEDWKIRAARIIANDDFDWENADYSNESDSDGYRAVLGGDDQGDKNTYCYVHDTSSGEEYEIDCQDDDGDDIHLFPHAPSETTGDNSFKRTEENFWRTDTHADDTAHTGNPDEANVAGLGIDTFRWNFSPGDKIGIVVEGISVDPVQTKDASYRIMWAMPKSMCDVEVEDFGGYPKTKTEIISVNDNGMETETVTRTTTESIVSRATTIATIRTITTTTTTVTDNITGGIISQDSTAPCDNNSGFFSNGTSCDRVVNLASSITLQDIEDVSDLNECLYDNLISPAENGAQSEKLNVSLSYSPDSPMNDPQDYAEAALSEGDELTITSSVLNAKDSNYLQYSWQVFEGDDPNPDSWGSPILKSDLPDVTQMIGIGLNSFKFKLNLSNPKKYLRVKLTVKENVGTNLTREGRTDVVIPINSTTNRIKVFNADVTNSTEPYLSHDSDEICNSGIEKAICPVAKNEIMAVEISSSGLDDFSWTIDGKPFTYSSCFFEGCNEEKQTNVAYFPILKNKGEQYSVSVIATNRATGEKVNVNRTFEVIDPAIKIVSLDENVCKPVLLGSYVDFDGREWKDYSENNFWALSNYPVKLRAEAQGFAVDPENLVWSVNGINASLAGAQSLGYGVDESGVLSLTPEQDGQIYTVSVGTVYSQEDLTKKALNKYWGVTYDQMYETVVGKTVDINTRNFAPELSDSGVGHKIFASAYMSAPAYFIFLLKVVLVGFLIIFTSRVVFAFSPEMEK